MENKRYRVVYTGKLESGITKEMAVSNLVLDVGISEEKARELLQVGSAVLKRFSSSMDAQKMAGKFARAGLVCRIEDRGADERIEEPSSADESALSSIFSRLSPVARRS